MFIVYVVGCPTVALIILVKNRKILDRTKMRSTFLILYQGLKFRQYYWEFMNTAVKCSLIMTHVFIVTKYKIYKALLGAGILIVYSFIQMRLRPYKIGLLNDLGNAKSIQYFIESRELLANGLTIF
jgi:hypothetical protein